MAKKTNDIAKPRGGTDINSHREKSDSSSLLPVVNDGQAEMEKDTAVVVKSDKVVTNCDHLLTITPIEDMIITLRGVQVIIDRDLATLYGVGTKRMNEQVRRNLNRFPPRFRFQLTKEEVDKVVANCDHLLSIKYSPTLPYVFTEQGVAMLASVLHSDTAVDVSVRIMDAFVAMRHFIASNAQVFQRLEVIEHHQLEMSSQLTKNDNQITEILKRLDQENATPTQGIFFDGQIFDAYTFVSDLIRSAKKNIVLFDNYVDDTVLTMLDKRKSKVAATIYTKGITKQFSLDLAKHNAQYQPIDVKQYDRVHDRYLCIDNIVYHIGASLKDLGKRWFSFNKMEMTAKELLRNV